MKKTKYFNKEMRNVSDNIFSVEKYLISLCLHEEWKMMWMLIS